MRNNNDSRGSDAIPGCEASMTTAKAREILTQVHQRNLAWEEELDIVTGEHDGPATHQYWSNADFYDQQAETARAILDRDDPAWLLDATERSVEARGAVLERKMQERDAEVESRASKLTPSQAREMIESSQSLRRAGIVQDYDLDYDAALHTHFSGMDWSAF